jgi:hypothetical protein
MKPLTLLLALGLTASTGRVINFDTCPLGKVPPGWSVAANNTGGAPQWQVMKDQTAPTQPYVLAQTSHDSNKDGHNPLAIFDGMSVQNGDVSVRIKPVSGQEGRAGGVVWRYRDANNYYLVRANALSKNVALYKVENGRISQLSALVPHEIPSNAWSILKVSVRGNRFQVFVNHHRILQGEDNTFRGAGKVGLWTLADSVTYFDDFRVYPK